MNAVLRWTGLGKLLALPKFFAFNLPRVTTVTGVLLVLGIAAIRLYPLVIPVALPTYLFAYFIVLIVAACVASAGMASGRSVVTRAGWALGSVVAAASMAMYLVSRTAGLPQLHEVIGRWDYPLGTFAILLSVMFLGLHATVLAGINIAVPQRREWHS